MTTKWRSLRCSLFHSYWPYAWVPLVLIFLCFDFKYQESLTQHRVDNVASFTLAPDLVKASEYVLQDVFFDPISRFSSRDTIVIIGNSVAAGSGSLDKQYFNSRLAETHNVINAAIDGEQLLPSSVLALRGIDAEFQSGNHGRVDVFVLYPPSRLYTGDWFKVTESIVQTACFDPTLRDYLGARCTGVKEPQWKESLENRLLAIIYGNMRCILSSSTVINWLSYANVTCSKLFERQRTSPSSLKALREQPFYAPNGTFETYSSDFFQLNLNTLGSETEIEKTVNSLVENMIPITQYLKEKNITSRVHFILTTELQAGLDHFEKRRSGMYRDIRGKLLRQIKSKAPHWNIIDLPAFGVDQYSDLTHYNEAGLHRLSHTIQLSLSSPPVQQ